MILRSAVLLGDSESRRVDVKIDGGRIAEIAPAGAVDSSKDHQELPLDGRVLGPGMWDEHVHIGMWAEYRKRVSLEQAQSAQDAVEAMAAGLTDQPGDFLHIGVGFRDGLWPDQKTLDLIDRYSGSRPWLLWSIDVHSCWLNSAAMERLGLSSPDGSGVFRERQAFAIAETTKERDLAIRDQWVAEAMDAAAQRGVVGIVDLDFDDAPTHWIRRRSGQDDFAVRVEAGVYPDYFDAAIARGDHTGREIAPGVHIGPLKVITDGSLNTRTAYCCEPYLGIPGHEQGAMNHSRDELEALMLKGVEAGFLPAFHAIGDEANRLVLDVFEAVGTPGRIEHAQLLRAVDFERFASLGVIASLQPQHAIDDRDVADHYWADRIDRVIAMRSLLDAGARVVLGSDAPVSPLDPLVQVAAACARTDDSRRPWVPAQRVSIQEALSASSRIAVREGEPADLAVFGADPLWLASALGTDPQRLSRALRELPVELTLVEGRITHSVLD